MENHRKRNPGFRQVIRFSDGHSSRFMKLVSSLMAKSEVILKTVQEPPGKAQYHAEN